MRVGPVEWVSKRSRCMRGRHATWRTWLPSLRPALLCLLAVPHDTHSTYPAARLPSCPPVLQASTSAAWPRCACWASCTTTSCSTPTSCLPRCTSSWHTATRRAPRPRSRGGWGAGLVAMVMPGGRPCLVEAVGHEGLVGVGSARRHAMCVSHHVPRLLHACRHSFGLLHCRPAATLVHRLTHTHPPQAPGPARQLLPHPPRVHAAGGVRPVLHARRRTQEAGPLPALPAGAVWCCKNARVAVYSAAAGLLDPFRGALGVRLP